MNNEVGTIQPLADVARLVRARAPHAALHTDAVQAVPWLDVAEAAAAADLVSVSAHKFGGPKGVGALVRRGEVPIEPLIEGGGQEWGLRSGTANVSGAVGMADGVARDVEAPGRRGRAHPAAARPARRWARRARARLVRERRRGAQDRRQLPRRLPRRRGRDAARRARPRRRVRGGGFVVHVGSDRAVARARGDGRSSRRRAGVDPAEPRATRRPTPTSTLRSSSSRGPSSSFGPRSARHDDGESTRVLVAMSGGVDSSVAAALLARRRARRHRRDPEAVGRRVRLRVLQCRRRRGRPPRRRPARHPALRVQLRRRVRLARRRALRRRLRRRPYAQPLRRVQPVDQVRPSARAGRRARVRRGRDRPPRTRAVATRRAGGSCCRGSDPAKDQSYVLYMLGQPELGRTLLPVGELTKAQVRDARVEPRTADGGQAGEHGRLLHHPRRPGASS